MTPHAQGLLIAHNMYFKVYCEAYLKYIEGEATRKDFDEADSDRKAATKALTDYIEALEARPEVTFELENRK